MTTDYADDDPVQNHEDARTTITGLAEFDAWVGGAWTSATDAESFETIDPVVDEPILSVPRMREADVDQAVQTADRAFEHEWSDTAPSERSTLLLSWCERLRSSLDDLALIESVDGGKPLHHARAEIDYAIDFIEYYAKVIVGDESSVVPHDTETHIYTRYEPYGVVGLIVPWNFPLIIAAWKMGPALAAGNTVVLKPAEETPLSALYAAKLSQGILPDGVLNVVTGFGREAGAPLTEHDSVSKISFTGEDTTGETIMESAAATITPVTLELGGKSPYIVFADADLEKAARDVSHGIFYNAGQSCDACSRVLVQDSIESEFMDLLDERREELQTGDPLREGTQIGPLVSREQYEKVTSYIETGRRDRGTPPKNGIPEDSSLNEGWYVEPTIFTEVDTDSQIAQEEIFGPVLAVTTFSEYDEAIELANDTVFGLAAGVATADTSVAHRAAADLEAGTVWVNGGYANPVPGAPFGGYKRSGIGRELGKDALRQYTREKSVYVSIEDPSL